MGLLEEYALSKLEEERIKAKIQELQPFVVQALMDEGLKKKEASFGTFTIKVTIPKTYEYSDETKAIEEKAKFAQAELEDAQEAERKAGTVKIIEGMPKENLVFNKPKIEKETK